MNFKTKLLKVHVRTCIMLWYNILIRIQLQDCIYSLNACILKCSLESMNFKLGHAGVAISTFIFSHIISGREAELRKESHPIGCLLPPVLSW